MSVIIYNISGIFARMSRGVINCVAIGVFVSYRNIVE